MRRETIHVEGEAPAEPCLLEKSRLGGSLALPVVGTSV